MKKKIVEIIICPKCGSSLKFHKKNLYCDNCKTSYLFKNGIFVLLDQKEIRFLRS
jgi:uncharacterized protein YbaR (Trm112 family)